MAVNPLHRYSNQAERANLDIYAYYKLKKPFSLHGLYKKYVSAIKMNPQSGEQQLLVFAGPWTASLSQCTTGSNRKDVGKTHTASLLYHRLTRSSQTLSQRLTNYLRVLVNLLENRTDC